MGLSKAQETAVFHNQGAMLVLAGPGSGKTTVITHRVLHLVKEVKVPPSHILVISFTRASALEMKERFLKLADMEFTLATFGTFHSVFLTILKQSYKNRNFSIITEQEKKNILIRCIKEALPPEALTEESTDLFLQEISLKKNSLEQTGQESLSFCSAEQFATVYSSYQSVLKRNNMLDFDDILLECYNLLTAYPDILAFWQNYFTYILIDEFQDINPIQFEIIRLLALPQNNLFVVGDDDQAIYGFRGASPRIMLHFQDYYPESILHLLDTNYRCAPEIVISSLKLISENKERYEKDIKPGRVEDVPETKVPEQKGAMQKESIQEQRKETCSIEKSGNDALVRIMENCFETQKEEFSFLAKTINNLHNNMVNYKDMAILFRKQSGLELLFFTLKKNKIPYNLKGSLPSLYDHFITKDLIAYFRLAYGEGSRADFLQIMEKPSQGFYRSELKPEWDSHNLASNFYEMEGGRKSNLELFLNKLSFLKKLPFYQAFAYIKNAFSYEKFLKAQAEKNKVDLSDYLSTFTELSKIGKECETYENWLDYLEEEQKNVKNETEGISLLTFHGSKGLEFKEVFIIDVNEEITPHKKALTDEEIEEERRMFYVAMTRAKEHLYLCYTEHYYNKKLAPSRFLSEYKFIAD